ncbi:MAG: aminoglycoside N(3)-acetyltransferase, partial [Candidatus Thorarchaeota archaeon]
LLGIGLKVGDTVMVHSSMRRLGWVVGGAPTVIDALMEVLTPEGTLVMPAHTTDNGEPSGWNFPAVPRDWWQTIRDEMPPYRPEISPTRRVGWIPETFRKYPGVIRSAHPQVSCSAWGKFSTVVNESHTLDQAFGPTSPYGKMYELNGKILLIGTFHDANTTLHFAESIASIPNFPLVNKGAAVEENGERVWKTWRERDFNSDDFRKLGEAYETAKGVVPAKVGQAESRLIDVRDLIDFAVEWFSNNRNYD